MKRRTHRSLVTAAALAALFAVPFVAMAAPEAPNAFPQLGEATHHAAPAPATETATFEVKGMTCGGCVLAVRAVLNRLDGVEEAEVSMRDGTAVVSFDPAKLKIEQIAAAIGSAGFEAVAVDPI